jgi:GMP synthase-like glutamine amidotransferase
MEGKTVDEIESADLVVFTGGEDVDPSLYDKRRHPTTSSNLARDIYEKEYYEMARELNKAIIGICRGSQFLCVMNGGILVQHQNNPSFLHNIQTIDGEYEITSTHHQAAFPFVLPKENYQILGWTDKMLPFHFGESFEEELNPNPECEIVFYPKSRSLGIQGHPEMMFHTIYQDKHRQTINFLRKIMRKYLFN